MIKEVVAARRTVGGHWILTMMPGSVQVTVDHEKFFELFPTPDHGPLGAKLFRDGPVLERVSDSSGEGAEPKLP